MTGTLDERLVRAARSGDAAAFGRLISRHYPMLVASCRRMVANEDLARDASQEASLRAMLGLERLRDDRRFGSWLIGIGLNVCRGLLIARARDVSLDALREDARYLEPVAHETEPVERIAANELALRVQAAIAALPPGQRQAVALFYIDGLTQAETAEEIGTRSGAVKTRLHKARTTLRTTLRDTYQEYIDMTEPTPELVPMRVAELRRTPGGERHIVLLGDDRGRRMPIWIGEAEATAMALVLEQVQLPRPGVYQFTAALLTGAGGRLREVRVTELTDATFYAQAVLSDDTIIDARPSDALTLALIAQAPIFVSANVLARTELDPRRDTLVDEVNSAVDDARVIAQESQARYAELMGKLLE